MCNKKFKLIATAVGLVAVLALGLAVPGATQQAGFSRTSILQNVNNMLATLTAATGIPLNEDLATVYSDLFLTLAFVPVVPDVQDEEAITLGTLVVGEDLSKVLSRGIYNLKVVKDKLWFIDRSTGALTLEIPAKVNMRPAPSIVVPLFDIEYTKMVLQRVTLAGSSAPIRGYICFKVKVKVERRFLFFTIEVEVEAEVCIGDPPK